MALVSDVAPLLSKERANEPDGLWATKQYGDLKVGVAQNLGSGPLVCYTV